MKKLMGVIAVLAVVGSVVAAEADSKAKPKVKSYDEVIREQGGEVLKPGTFTGRVVLINAQKRLPEADIRLVADLFAKETHCNVAVAEKAEGAAIALTVIDDAKEPTILVATEEHWGKVNVAKLVDDLPGENAKKKFFASRARKMIVKALSLLCGGGGSYFQGNIMNAATVRELDLLKEQIPVDMLNNYGIYLKKLGVTRKEVATYLDACYEGWAPAPTNDVQKAIWKEVKNPATRWDKDFGGKQKK